MNKIALWEKSKREEFRNILLMLSQEQELLEKNDRLQQVYECLEALYMPSKAEDTYGKKFRHYYSDIFEVLSSIKSGLETGDVSILGQNLEILYYRYEPISLDISAELKKVYDHISLDIARINYSDRGDKELSEKPAIKDIRDQIGKLGTNLTSAKAKQEEVEKELSNQQREYVAILGIFAAVVITFIGGLAFSTSVLNNIDKVSTGKLMIISLTIGLILLFLIFGLFYYIDRLVNKSVSFVNIKPLWGYMFVIALLMLCALYLSYNPIFDTSKANITLNIQYPD